MRPGDAKMHNASPPYASQEGDDEESQSELSPLSRAFQQNFLHSPAPAALDNAYHPPVRRLSSSYTMAADNWVSDPVQSLQSGRLGLQQSGHSKDINQYQNFAQNEALSGQYSRSLSNIDRLTGANLQANDVFGGNMNVLNQNIRQYDVTASLRPPVLPSQNVNDVNSMDQINQGGLTANSASSEISDYRSNIFEYQQFFGTGSGPYNPTQSSSDSASVGAGFPFLTSQSSLASGFPNQQVPLGFQRGSPLMQNTLANSNLLSVASSQGPLLNSMNWQSSQSSSWQQQQQQQRQQQQLPQDVSLAAGPIQMPPEITRKGRGRSSTFPLKLHQMLIDLENESGGAAIASFLPHGRAFHIHQPKEFCKDIMPRYFRTGTFSSFQRQLNLYDFQRIVEGPEKGAYWHELFQKDKPMLSTNMKRCKVKGVTRARQEQRLKRYELQKELDDLKKKEGHR